MDGECTLCPRRCGVRREESTGFCGASNDLEVSSVCMHRGEEPPLNPIVNVFFTHCNLQCIYCQNWQISGKGERLKVKGERYSVDALADAITSHLWLHKVADHSSPLTSHLIGFVTAAHYADHLPAIVEALRQRWYEHTLLYNIGG